MNHTKLAVCLAVVAVLVGLFVGADDKRTGHPMFEAWKLKHGVSYASSHEHDFRQAVYLENLAYIEAENQKGHSYELGENEFMDLKKEEFIRLYLQTNVPHQLNRMNAEVVEVAPNDVVDWVAAGAVTSVKNQGSSGTVVPFVAAGALEAITKIRDGKLRDLPEKSLEDCAGQTSFWEYFEYARTKGLDYVYVAKQCGGPFKTSGANNVTTCVDLTSNILAGPVAVAVDASNWQLYKSGIFTNCGTSVNHSALLVTMTDTYWRLKNTWGTTWGESGYIRIGPGNTCGVCRFGCRPK